MQLYHSAPSTFIHSLYKFLHTYELGRFLDKTLSFGVPRGAYDHISYAQCNMSSFKSTEFTNICVRCLLYDNHACVVYVTR